MEVRLGAAFSSLPYLASILFAQGILVAYAGGGRHFVWLLFASGLALGAGILATVRLLQDRSGREHRGHLLIPALVALWLMLVQGRSVAPEIGLAPTLAWVMALAFVPVARLLQVRDRVPALFLVLLLAPALHALAYALPMLADRDAHPFDAVDPNVVADRLLLAGIGMLAGADWACRTGRLSSDVARAVPAIRVLVMVGVALLVQEALGSRFVVLVSVPLVLAYLALSGRLGARIWIPLAMAAAYLTAWFLPGIAGSGAEVLDALDAGRVARSGQTRGGLWSAALEFLGQAPLTGTGLGSFAVLYPPHRPPEDPTVGDLAHNDWLQLTHEAGLPFLVFLLAVLGFLLRCGWLLLLRRFRREEDDAPRADPFPAAAFAVCALLPAHALINFPLYDPVLLNLLACAVVVLGASLHPEHGVPGTPPVEATHPDYALRRSATIAAVTGVVVVAFWVRCAAYGAALVTLAERSPLPGVPSLALNGEQRLRWADRFSGNGLAFGMPAYVQAATLAQLLREGVLEPDEELLASTGLRFSGAIERSPWVIEHYVQYSKFLRERGAPLAKRIAPLEEALRRDPFAPRPWLALAYNYSIAEEWDRHAHRVGAEWLPRCVYGARTDWRPTVDLLNLLPMEVKAEHAEETGRCAAWLLRMAAPLPALPASVTIPERPR